MEPETWGKRPPGSEPSPPGAATSVLSVGRAWLLDGGRGGAGSAADPPGGGLSQAAVRRRDSGACWREEVLRAGTPQPRVVLGGGRVRAPGSVPPGPTSSQLDDLAALSAQGQSVHPALGSEMSLRLELAPRGSGPASAPAAAGTPWRGSASSACRPGLALLRLGDAEDGCRCACPVWSQHRPGRPSLPLGSCAVGEGSRPGSQPSSCEQRVSAQAEKHNWRSRALSSKLRPLPLAQSWPQEKGLQASFQPGSASGRPMARALLTQAAGAWPAGLSRLGAQAFWGQVHPGEV